MQTLILLLGLLFLGACGSADQPSPFSDLSAPDSSFGGSPGVSGGAQGESGSGGISGAGTGGSAGALAEPLDAGADAPVFWDATVVDGSSSDGAVDGSLGGFGSFGGGGSSGSAGALSGGSGGSGGDSGAGAGGLGGSAGSGGLGASGASGGTGGVAGTGGGGSGGLGGSGGQAPNCVQDQFNNQCRDSAENDGWLQTDKLGKCFQDRCCSGCTEGGVVNGTSCEPGTSLRACGYGGLACEDCEDFNECTDDACVGGTLCSNQGKIDVACTSISSTGKGVCKAQIGGSYGCIPCGGIAELCCVGDTCDSGLSCVNDRCKAPCGNSGEVCCSGSYCNTGLFCQSGTCEAPPSCGGLNEACCATGSQCKSSLSACVNGVCISCGNPNGPCCPGAVCTSGYFCIGGSCGTR
jgi:hypothetical protein